MPVPVLLITRPEPDGAAFAKAVLSGDPGPVHVILSPLIGIVPRPAALPDGPLSGVIVTSRHGAEALSRLGVPQDVPVWCVGDSTARAAQDQGYAVRSAGRDAEALVVLILSGGTGGRLLHLRGEHARGDVAGRLTAGGCPCTERIVYAQEQRPLTAVATEALAGPAPVVIPVFSPRTGSILAAQGPFRAPLRIVAISPAVAEAVTDLPRVGLTVAPDPDAAAMQAATVASIRRAAALEGAGRDG